MKQWLLNHMVLVKILSIVLACGITATTSVVISSSVAEGKQGEPGPIGVQGVPGADGEDGITPYIGENGNWWIGNEDTGISAKGIKGEQGNIGLTGLQGEADKDGTSVTGAYVDTDYHYYVIFKIDRF